MRIDVLNGVNLDLLGRRDPGRYGAGSLQELETQIYAWARERAAAAGDLIVIDRDGLLTRMLPGRR